MRGSFSTGNFTTYRRFALEITDVIGQKVFEKNPFGQGVANYIDLSHLQNSLPAGRQGIYFLKIYTEDEVRVEKVVIEYPPLLHKAVLKTLDDLAVDKEMIRLDEF